MTMANNKTQCFICNKKKPTYTCEGCSQRFCLMDLTKHRQILNNELDQITNEYNQFKQEINEQQLNTHDLSLLDEINQWEIDSIEKIKQKAEDCREIVVKSSRTYIGKKFNNLREQIEQIHEGNEFNETNLEYLRNQLMKVTQDFYNSSNVSIQQDSKPFINEISVISLTKPTFNKWKQNAITIAGGIGYGEQLNQLRGPQGIFIDKNKNIFIADGENHRIVEWKHGAKQGQIIAGGNGRGHRTDQLNYPTDVVIDQQTHSIIIADFGNRRVIQWLNQNQQILIDNIDCYGLTMDKHGFLYVSDYKKNEVRRWKMGEYNSEGVVVAGGNGQGDRLNQFSYATFLFVDEGQTIYVSDWDNHRVMKWRKGAKEGRIVAGGNGKGENFNQLSNLGGVVIDGLGQIYVADSGNDRVMRWCEGKEEGEIVVGGTEKENQSNQLNGFCSLSFDDEGNLYVGYIWNARIVKFEVAV
ncbi:unnamed protein product [Adineta steineri]|uniref:Uncharacterized protein n=2 Tax=Adineta steineri TaxID=433720 RepID=A0A815SU77_9BILA|nr:unnamed protein product [Adineta steineri]